MAWFAINIYCRIMPSGIENNKLTKPDEIYY